MSANRAGDSMSAAGGLWSIADADWRDYTQLTALEKTCFPKEDVWPFWDLIGALTLPGLVRLKAVMEGQIVGFISGEREAGRRLGWVTSLAVAPPYRRRGIAVALLAECESALGMPAVRLSVRATNQAAIGLYQAAGYTLVDRWKKYYPGGEDALVFEKKR